MNSSVPYAPASPILKPGFACHNSASCHSEVDCGMKLTGGSLFMDRCKQRYASVLPLLSYASGARTILISVCRRHARRSLQVRTHVLIPAVRFTLRIYSPCSSNSVDSTSMKLSTRVNCESILSYEWTSCNWILPLCSHGHI